ncbi:MAG TPA: 1-deoxy-D-xylulose-5-phosphate reductoisomerase [Chthoniobacteraceae bacterium]|jgi:1-deoxy-D-xylulose-5-phosphate reductoisomerase|nr:1-deoxy-D-xylulose-5-phosphate reductoisomerase [Chthoniobacteraceae bacterium]
MRKRRVVVLGATGSIGQSAAKVARDIPERMEIVGLSGNRNLAKLQELAAEFPNAALCTTCPHTAIPASLEPRVAHRGEAGLVDLATLPEADLVLIAIVGTGGLKPALAAIQAGKDIAVASKEILVMAGQAVMQAAHRKGVKVLPVDSEHNAIFQCLEGRDPAQVRRLILTASGGPFRKLPAAELAHVTRAQALRHPTWNMGEKITIDSATLFNKGLEMIEARWLFDVEMARLDVVVHPQSIVHSMVEFVDGSVLAQLSHSDMCFPIQYAVTWPERVPNTLRPLDFAHLSRLDFEAPRRHDFPALDLARQAGERGGTLPAVLNAANEVAVAAFLDSRIPFPRIWQTVAHAMDRHAPIADPSLDAILEADREARIAAQAFLSAAQ